MILATNNIVNWQSSLNTDLVHWWGNLPHGEMGGGSYWHDLCGRSDAAWEISGAPQWFGAAGRPGGFGCVNFTDTSNNESFTATPSSLVPFGANQRTISFWFNSRSSATDNTYCMLQVGGTSTGGRDLSIFYEDNGVSVVWFNHRTIIHKSALSTGNWYHFDLVIPDGATDTDDPLYYLNGVAATPSTEAGTTQTLDTASGNITIGGWSIDDTKCFDGLLADIRIRSRGLPATEIQNSYLDSMTGYRKTWNWLRHDRYFSAPAVGGVGLGFELRPASLSATSDPKIHTLAP